jgi:hypothetical protein
METPLHIGLKNTAADSMIIIWPDNTFQKLDKKSDSVLSVTYQEGLPLFDYGQLKPSLENATRQMVDITDDVQLSYRHEENSFVEFDREPLMPFMVSREGPALAVGI